MTNETAAAALETIGGIETAIDSFMTMVEPNDKAIPISEAKLSESIIERKQTLPFISDCDYDHIPVHINGVRFVALLDTGSKANLIHNEVWQQVRGVKGALSQLEDPQGVYLRGVTGHKSIPLGATWVNLRIGDFCKTISVLVVEGTFTPVILNNQFIHEHLDTVRLSGTEAFRYKIRTTGFILQPAKPEYIFAPDIALIWQDTIIPPGVRVRVPLTIRRVFPHEALITLTGFKNQPNTIEIYAVPFYYRRDGPMYVVIKNISKEAITVYRGRPVGKVILASTDHIDTNRPSDLMSDLKGRMRGEHPNACYVRVDCSMVEAPQDLLEVQPHVIDVVEASTQTDKQHEVSVQCNTWRVRSEDHIAKHLKHHRVEPTEDGINPEQGLTANPVKHREGLLPDEHYIPSAPGSIDQPVTVDSTNNRLIYKPPPQALPISDPVEAITTAPAEMSHPHRFEIENPAVSFQHRLHESQLGYSPEWPDDFRDRHVITDKGHYPAEEYKVEPSGEAWDDHAPDKCTTIDCGFCYYFCDVLTNMRLMGLSDFNDEGTTERLDPDSHLQSKIDVDEHQHGAEGCTDMPKSLQTLYNRGVQDITRLVEKGALGTDPAKLQQYIDRFRLTCLRRCSLFARHDEDLGAVPPDLYQATFSLKPGGSIKPRPITYSEDTKAKLKLEVKKIEKMKVLQEVKEPSE